MCCCAAVGDKVPADVRIMTIYSTTLRVDQAILTGLLSDRRIFALKRNYRFLGFHSCTTTLVVYENYPTFSSVILFIIVIILFSRQY